MQTSVNCTPQNRLDAVLADYIAGRLSGPSSVLVSAHLELKPDNRGWVRSLEGVGGALLEDVEDAPLDNRDAMLASIFSDTRNDIIQVDKPVYKPGVEGGFPSALRDYVGFDINDIPWRKRLPGLKEYKLLDTDDVEASLLWIRAGQAMPTHTHEGTELTLVLRGSFDDSEGHYARGDVSIADETVDHRPVAGSSDDCICFAVMDAPLRLTGPIGRLFGPLIGR